MEQEKKGKADRGNSNRKGRSAKNLQHAHLPIRETLKYHDRDCANISDGVGKIHEKAQVAGFPGRGDQPFEHSGVKGNIGDVEANAARHHEHER